MAKWVPFLPVLPLIWSFVKGVQINLFFAVLVTAFVGALGGYLIGMILGTFVGYVRRERFAFGDKFGDRHPYIYGLLLPAVGLSLFVGAQVWIHISGPEFLRR